MYRIRRGFAVLLVVALCLLTVVHPVLAAGVMPPLQAEPSDPGLNTYGFVCNEGVCTFRFKNIGIQIPALVAASSSLALEALLGKVNVLPTGSQLKIAEDVTLQTPVGIFDLFDADLTVDFGVDNSLQRLHGTAQIPLPSLGILNNGAAIAPAIAEIGLDLGKYLHHLQAPLDPERHYLFIKLGAGFPSIQRPQTPTNFGEPNSAGPGQNLTLVIDPQQAYTYIQGQLSVRNLAQLALLDDLMALTLDLPFRFANETMTVQVEGALTGELTTTFLKLEGLYAIEKNFVSQWMGVNDQPVAVNGALLINHEGILLRGATHAALFPDRLFTGDLMVEAFTPFDGQFWNAYVKAGGNVEIPALAFHSAGELQLSPPTLEDVAENALVQEIAAVTSPVFVVMKESANGAVVYAARGYQATKQYATASGEWAVDKVIDGATGTVALAGAAYQSTGDLARHSYDWVAGNISNGGQRFAHLAQSGYQSAAAWTGDGYAWVAGSTVTGVQWVVDWTYASRRQ